jgi:hypothetical protein
LEQGLIRPFRPAFLGHDVDENSRRYLRRTRA